MTTKTEPRVMRSWMSFAGPAGDVKLHERLRDDDPRYLQARDYFVPDETLPADAPSEFDRVVREAAEREAARVAEEQARFLELAKKNKLVVTTAPVPTLRLLADLPCWRDGRPCLLLKGSTLLATDPVVAQFPDAFEQPARR